MKILTVNYFFWGIKGLSFPTKSYPQEKIGQRSKDKKGVEVSENGHPKLKGRIGNMRLIIVVVLVSLAMAAAGGKQARAEQLPDISAVEALQAEVAQLRQRIAELEAQLQELQKQQKASAAVVHRYEPITLHGYIQMRYEVDSSRTKDSPDLKTAARENFYLPRALFDAYARPLKGGLFRVQINATKHYVELKDAYLELKSSDGKFTFGHFKVPLLEELLESSSVRFTPEPAFQSDKY